MAQVTFVVGGPGSGKTEEVVSRLARGYKDGRFWDVLLLAPTVRHGDQLRRRLVAKCGVAMGFGVESLSQFSLEACRESGSSVPRGSPVGCR